MAIGFNIDTNFWINTLIFNKLSDISPLMNLKTEDRRVFDICCRDFKNYLHYINTNHLKVEDEDDSIQKPLDNPIPTQEIVPQDFLITIINNINGVIGTLHHDLQNTKEISDFLDVWISWWWRKWTERTKVILRAEDAPKNTIAASLNWSPVGLSQEERVDFTGIIVDKLIQYGEICCTQIIAESLITKAVGEIKSWTIENKIQLISKLQRQAKTISFTHGVLIFLRPDNYFKLREFRDDGTAANKIV
jgi:hypothetical protein